MKILWISNTIFPEPSKVLGFPEPLSGGWMYGLAKKVSGLSDVKLAVATVYSGKEFRSLIVDEIVYYLLPTKSMVTYQKSLEPFWHKISEDFKPDLVHIHGTEFSHGLACMRALSSLKYIISIQGLTSVYTRYYYAGIDNWTILKNVTFRDIIRGKTIFQGKKEFERRGRLEQEYLCRTNHVIGRTLWDNAHVKVVNPTINYHFCNETLRDIFYKSRKWDIHKKKEFTIFLSQATYPIKGLHQVLKATYILKKEFPRIKIRVAGRSIITGNGIEKLRQSGYGSYIGSLIRKMDLNENVAFLGSLSEERMVQEYQNAHLFICPSSIENSPNSLGEAQILGVPVIAAFVGGVPDMITHGKSGLLYRFEETEMLAKNISQIFTDTSLSKNLSEGAIIEAEHRHDCNANLYRTIQIYRSFAPIKECI